MILVTVFSYIWRNMGLLDSLKNIFGGGNSDAAGAASVEETSTPEVPDPTMEAPMADMGGKTDAAPADSETEASAEETPVV